MGRIIINGKEFEFAEGETVLEVALKNGIYIPHLCYFPGVGTAKGISPKDKIFIGEKSYASESQGEFQGCGLCVVSVKGEEGLFSSCTLKCRDGMEVSTNTEEVKEAVASRISSLLENHPHACLFCAQAEGCDRKICSMKVPEEERCCWKFGLCEFQKVVKFINPKSVPPYRHKGLPVVDDNPLFTRDYNLCIGCLRCVIVCERHVGASALGFVFHDGKVVVGTVEPTLSDSGCKFCLCCVEVCPTGALKEKKERKTKSKLRRALQKPVLPPSERLIPFTEENVNTVPESEGVYMLYSENGELFKVVGTLNLKKSLTEELQELSGTCKFFSFEEDPMYTSRERQILEVYIKEHGELPPGNKEPDDLFDDVDDL